MKKLFRFKTHQVSESTEEDNIKRAEFYGNEGLYLLSWYIDSDVFSIFFPDEKIKYFQLDILKPENHDRNPFRNIEDGKLLSWIKHMLYSEDSKRTSIADEYKFESDIFHKQTVRVDNTLSADFNGIYGLYQLKWYPDENIISIVFPSGEIRYFRTEILSPDRDDVNPLIEIEDGKLLAWIRHMLLTDEYNRQSFANESDSNEVESFTFNYNDGYYTAKYNIATDGNIILTFPERSLVGTPDQIFTTDEMGNLNSIFGGKLLYALKKDYERVTGKKF